MPALIQRNHLVLVSALTGLILAAATPAHATKGFGGTDGKSEQEANTDDSGNLYVGVGGVQFNRSKNGSGNSTGALTSTTPWTPPACWYAPTYTPQQLADVKVPVWEAGSTGNEWDTEQRKKYLNEDDHSKDFNKDKTGKGYWWGSYVNKSYPPGWDSCTEDYFWVDTGDAPPANIPNTITPEILAGLAYNEIRVPSTKVTLAPAGPTKVNLPTWAWLDGADFKPVSVTASVPVLNLSATATAEPYSLQIEPGTADAVTYPASGVCQFNNGSIGEPYAAGKAAQTPPCGVRYLRSSGDGTFPLRATITWKISWTGSGGAGDDLPDGAFGATQDVVVQEIQAVNR